MSFDGTGLAHFSPGVVSLGGFSNEIRLRFRTFQSDGVLLFYINTAGSDLLAIELRGGVPYFLFDAGSGTGVVSVASQGVVFNDGQWHSVVASQSGQRGVLILDGVYTDTSNSTGTDRVISSFQALHIGGVPDSLPRQTVTGGVASSRISGGIFAGCVFGVVLNGQALDFSLSDPLLSGVDVVNGCPVEQQRGWSFLGGGFLGLSGNNITDFTMTFDLRTLDPNALITFAHSSDLLDGVGIELRNSTLNLIVSSNGMVSRTMVGGEGDVCDGAWHRLELVLLTGPSASLSLDDGSPGSLPLPSSVLVLPDVYLGGIPQYSMSYNLAANSGLVVDLPLSGCVRMVELVTGEGIRLDLVTTSSALVRFDGCGLGGGMSCESPLDRNVGSNMTFADVGLDPFTGECISMCLLVCDESIHTSAIST